MKKIVLIVNIVLFVFICIFLIVDIDQNQSIICNIGTQKSIQKLEESTTLTTENILQNLMFNGEMLPYDTQTSTFYLPLSMENESWEFGELMSGDDRVSILFKDDFRKIAKLDAIANNTSFEFLAYTNNKYRSYYLVFTGLPIMNITMNEGSMGDSAQIDMSLYSAKTKSEWVKRSMANMRVRGGTSRSYPKKAYKLELTKFDNSGNTVNNNMSLLNMRKDNDWILYAMYNDDTKIRDKLSIDIWNEFGAKDNPFSCDFGTKLEYVELVVNGEYYGIYGLMEPVDAKKLDIMKSNEASGQEYFYKRTEAQELTLDDFIEDSDTLMRCGFELKGLSNYGTISLQSWEPLINYIRVYNLEDEEYVKQIQETIDINSITNAWLFLQIVSGMDNRAKNMYYVSKMTSAGRKIFFVPWDLDLTWGNVHKSEDAVNSYTAFEPEILKDRVDWWDGDKVIDYNVNGAASLAKDKWSILRNTILTNESLIGRIEELENTVVNSGAMAREMYRWPEGAHTYDYSNIKKYAIDKMEYLDSYFGK
jgi:hypothetical protein